VKRSLGCQRQGGPYHPHTIEERLAADQLVTLLGNTSEDRAKEAEEQAAAFAAWARDGAVPLLAKSFEENGAAY
jgi:hypothetical protein